MKEKHHYLDLQKEDLTIMAYIRQPQTKITVPQIKCTLREVYN